MMVTRTHDLPPWQTGPGFDPSRSESHGLCDFKSRAGFGEISPTGSPTASSHGSSLITDTLAGNGSPKATPDTFERAVAIRNAQPAHHAQDLRFTTDTLGGDGLPKAIPDAFERGVAIHNRSAGTAGALLAMLGAALLVSRRHMRLGV